MANVMIAEIRDPVLTWTEAGSESATQFGDCRLPASIRTHVHYDDGDHRITSKRHVAETESPISPHLGETTGERH